MALCVPNDPNQHVLTHDTVEDDVAEEPTTFGNYQITGVLGKGAYGTVYLASVGRTQYAVKSINKQVQLLLVFQCASHSQHFTRKRKSFVRNLRGKSR